MNETELKTAIVRAADRGDVATVERLQSQYRSEFSTTRISGPDADAITLIESSPQRSSARATLPAVEETGAPLPTRVWISRRALIELQDFPWRSGIEHACWLFGSRNGREIEIYAVDGWTEGQRDVVEFSRDRQLERNYAARGLKLAGFAHGHRDGTTASDEDEHAWKQLARELGRPVVGLIVGGSGPGSSYPFADAKIRAWIAGGSSLTPASIFREDSY